jgi:hypothetical protein
MEFSRLRRMTQQNRLTHVVEVDTRHGERGAPLIRIKARQHVISKFQINIRRARRSPPAPHFKLGKPNSNALSKSVMS